MQAVVQECKQSYRKQKPCPQQECTRVECMSRCANCKMTSFSVLQVSFWGELWQQQPTGRWRLSFDMSRHSVREFVPSENLFRQRSADPKAHGRRRHWAGCRRTSLSAAALAHPGRRSHRPPAAAGVGPVAKNVTFHSTWREQSDLCCRSSPQGSPYSCAASSGGRQPCTERCSQITLCIHIHDDCCSGSCLPQPWYMWPASSGGPQPCGESDNAAHPSMSVKRMSTSASGVR